VAIAPGTRIGNYEVAALIGSGGMGEVYRAHDARLGRDVAIKVLPPAFSTDPDRLRRFEQEARAAAALNHPNILTVHEVGSFAADSNAPASPYVVSELLEGQTLRDALSGPLPIRRVVDYATQIASGLAAAHDKGVVHRDLKPENLFITRDGRIKILDFGLAKLREPEPVAAGVTMAATRNLETGVGVVLGTAGYMSPEQVRAQPVDHRTDIFSFGAVLYEMISGARAFRGDTAADTISAILKNDPPDLSSLHGAVPPTLERIVHHCLEKAPELRFQAARDIVFNLEALSTTSPATSSLIAPAPPKRRRLGALAAAAASAVALVVLAAGAGWWFASGSHESPAFRQVTFRHGTLGTARFTADGQNIVYTAAWEALPPELFIVPANETGGRSFELKNASLLTVGRNNVVVALTPARLTPFLTPGTLARGSMTGGAPKPEVEGVQAADYARDGSSLAIVRCDAQSRRCALEFPIGKEIYRGGALLTDLRFSRDGTHLAFIEHPAAGDDRGQAVILRADGGKVATGPMRESHRGLAWSPSGDEVWTTAPLADGVVEALDLRGRKREVLQVPGRLHLRDVHPDGRLLMEQGTVSRGMIVVTNDGATQRDLSWLNYSYVRDISRDGQLLLFEEEGTFGYRTFVRKVDGSPAVEIGAGYAVALSHDNSQALSFRLSKTGPELWLEPVGPGQARRVSPPELTPLNVGAQFFSDGKRIVYAARQGDRPPRIYVQALDGSPPRPISEEGYGAPLLSGDDRWIGANGLSGPVLLPAEGGTPTPVRGLQQGETPRRWTNDARVFVAAVTPTNVRIDRLNPWTGERTAWRQMPVPAITGMRISPPFITPDGSVLTYGYNLSSSDLYVVSGVR
jgi:eukaryotic-like serine/threonine-protein kinase